VSEDERVGVTLLQLSATDADFTYDNTRLQYHLIASTSANSSSSSSSQGGGQTGVVSDGMSRFRVTESTGHLILVSSLDREVTDHYELTVTANDHGQPLLTTTTTVSIYMLLPEGV